MNNSSPFESSPPSREDSNQFHQSVAPHWKEIQTRLAALRPPDWQGFRFEGTVEDNPQDQRFSVSCMFQDSVSNRTFGAPRVIQDRLAELYVLYRNFHHLHEWKKVTIKQDWDAEAKNWHYQTNWEYRW